VFCAAIEPMGSVRVIVLYNVKGVSGIEALPCSRTNLLAFATPGWKSPGIIAARLSLEIACLSFLPSFWHRAGDNFYVQFHRWPAAPEETRLATTSVMLASAIVLLVSAFLKKERTQWFTYVLVIGGVIWLSFQVLTEELSVAL